MNRRPIHPRHFDRGVFLAALAVALVPMMFSPAVGIGTATSASNSGSEPETMEIAVGKQNAGELGYSSSMLNQALSGIGSIATLLIIVVGVGLLAYIRLSA